MGGAGTAQEPGLASALCPGWELHNATLLKFMKVGGVQIQINVSVSKPLGESESCFRHCSC